MAQVVHLERRCAFHPKILRPGGRGAECRFQYFMWVRLVVLEGRVLVLNLSPHHEVVVRLLGVERYYLLT
ncbi:hypothetical protein EWH23_09470 [Meiothermus sp. PNK-Is4]|nr:hypothetical protein DNA98_15825 [Meiothermus sp. Pnk-1]RYM36442.1 hypothetical protein EWH23_09470 [Meiothermus sp. PNK-Is4]